MEVVAAREVCLFRILGDVVSELLEGSGTANEMVEVLVLPKAARAMDVLVELLGGPTFP